MALFEEYGKDKPDPKTELSEKERLEKSLKLTDSQLHEQLFILGRLYYELYADDPDPDLRMFVDDITKTQQLIERICGKLVQCKKLRRCPQCLFEYPAELPRCPECGAGIRPPKTSPVRRTAPEPQSRPNGQPVRQPVRQPERQPVRQPVRQPERQPAQQKPRHMPPPVKLCPKCGFETRERDALFCNSCGAKLVERKPAAIPPGTGYCPRCGMTFTDRTIRFCLNCGNIVRWQ